MTVMKKMVMVLIAVLIPALVASFLLLNTKEKAAASPCHSVDLTKIIIDTNNERSKLGLSPLQESSLLDNAATMKARDMVTVHYWAHNSPTGVTPWHWFELAGYNYQYAGENLEESTEPGDVVAEWMASPEHKANILNPHYTEVGLATACGYTDREVTLVVAEYGTKK